MQLGVESIMQISRHWRLNPQRYRLEGFRNPNGNLSLQRRPMIKSSDLQTDPREEETVRVAIPVPTA